jgi:tetratricopeptide (TPR) repeat protein
MGKQRTSNRSEGGLGRRPARAWVPKTLHVMLVLAALAAIIYGNSLRNELVFDDNMLISYNPSIRNLALYPKIFGWEARRTVPLAPDRGVTHRPVRTAVMALEYALFGRHPAGYRAVNILLHILNGALVFGLLRRLLGRPWPALGAAVLFVVHPIQTEAVAYIAGQRDVLFTTFYLLGFLSFVRYRATGRPRDLGLAGLAYLLSLLTKEMAITLPLLCVAYDLVRALPGADAAVPPPLPQALRDGLRVTVAQSTRLYLLGAALLAAVLAYFVLIANPSRQHELWGGGLGPTLNTSARILVVYLKQLVLPLTLNADYSYNAFPVSTSVADPRGLFALLLLGGLGYGLVRLLPLDRWLTFGGLWFFLTLLPVSQLIPHHELMAEHYLYLPSAGLFLTVGLLAERWLAPGRHRAALAAAFALVVVLLGVRTMVRNRDWRDELTLWSKTVQTAPQAMRVRQNLGQTLKGRGRYEEAIEQFQAVGAIEPGRPSSHIAVADVYRLMGRYDEAAQQFRKALALSPGSVAARLGLVQTYAAMGREDKAFEASRELSGIRFGDEQSYYRFADALQSAGLNAQAIEAYRKALELAPFNATIQSRIGKAFGALGQHAAAAAAYREAIRLDPRSVAAHAALGANLLQAGDPGAAVQPLQQALQLAPEAAEVHNNLGIAYSRMGRQAEALAEFQRALALEPDSAEFQQNLALAQRSAPAPSLAELQRAIREAPTSAKAHYNLGSAYANQGDSARALREFQTALKLDPSKPLIHYALGLLYSERGENALARQAWERALQVDPSFALAQERLAELKGAGRAGLPR